MIAEACEQCGATRRRGARFCSYACSHTASRNSEEKVCEACGVRFTSKPSQSAKYCSSKCYHAQRTKLAHVPRTCAQCGAAFDPRSKTHMFCSSTCLGVSQRKPLRWGSATGSATGQRPGRRRVGESRACRVCGGVFDPWTNSTLFCSKKCCVASTITITLKPCEYCKKDFKPWGLSAKYCSRKCAGLARRTVTDRFKKLQSIICNKKRPPLKGAIRAAQGNRCAACCDILGAAPRDSHWDHCHATGKLRGVLCRPCNMALGHIFDDPIRLALLHNYLVDHGAPLPYIVYDDERTPRFVGRV